MFNMFTDGAEFLQRDTLNKSDSAFLMSAATMQSSMYVLSHFD